MDLQMCLAIRSEQGLETVLRPYCTLCGLNAQFLFDMNGPRVRQLHTSSGSSGMMTQVGGGSRAATWGGRAIVGRMQCKRQHSSSSNGGSGRPCLPCSAVSQVMCCSSSRLPSFCLFLRGT